MNNKKNGRYSYGTKGRGTRRELVRLNAAKVSQRERILNEQRSSNGIYEDVMVYVKDQAISTRKPRGRPRKFQLENNLNQPAVRPSPPEIIYLPPVGQRSNRAPLIPPPQHQESADSYSHIFLKQSQTKTTLSSKSGVKTIGTNSPAHTTLRPTLLNPSNQIASAGSNPLNQKFIKAKHCSQVVLESNSYSQTALRKNANYQNILGSSIQPQTIFRTSPYSKTILGSNLHPQSVLRSNQLLIGPSTQPQTDKSMLEATPVAVTRPVTTKQSEAKNNWPEDLQEVRDMWDQYPEQQVNHWLKSPLSFNPSDLPPVVVRIHQLVEEWDESEEAKLQIIGDLLLDNQDLPLTVSSEPPPKVVVEVQPNTQHCGVWSSMDDLAV